MGSTAQAYSSDNQLASALAAAHASAFGASANARASAYGADQQLQAALLHATNNNNSLNWQRGLDAYGIAGQHGAAQDANKIFGMQSSQDYLNVINQILGQWGTQTSVNQGPTYSTGAGQLQGALGGALGPWDRDWENCIPNIL